MCGFHLTMLIISITSIILIFLATYWEREFFLPLFLAFFLVIGLCGYGAIGTTSACKSNLTKQCEIVTFMFNDSAATVVYKDVFDKEVNMVDNTIKGVAIIKSGKFQVICTYDVDHYGNPMPGRIKYTIVDAKVDAKVEKEADIKVEKNE